MGRVFARLRRRGRGFDSVQAVLLCGAAFLIVWGLMSAWGAAASDVGENTAKTVRGEIGKPGDVGKNPGGGGGEGEDEPTPTPTPTPTPAPGGLTTLPTGTPQNLQQMDGQTLFVNMSPAARLAWYRAQLAPYAAQLRQSAAANGIPEQLLATVILNELADINRADVWQQYLGLGGSLGIAQIQVSTAVAHDLVTYPGDNTAASNWEAIVEQRLTIPEVAIEAAAREIRHLLTDMTAHTGNPWQQRFGFNLSALPTNPADLYAAVNGADARERELNLAMMVVAAYNSPGIVHAVNPASITSGDPGFIYRRGIAHGSNGTIIAGELFDAVLYH